MKGPEGHISPQQTQINHLLQRERKWEKGIWISEMLCLGQSHLL